MAFQTNVFRGGEWVTETVDVQAVLRASAPRPAHKQRLPKPPRCGILTRTLVESQNVNLILPVRLRSPYHNDVAFIGDHTICIRELRRDGQLQDVIRKSDFSCRIRNAAVLGSLPDSIQDDEDSHFALLQKAEDDETSVRLDGFRSTPAAHRSAPLSPQLLLLILESGDSVFLSIRSRADGQLDFVTSRFESPGEQLVYPGFHLAVDPSSRYMVLGCAQDLFVVYELESLATLDERYRGDEPLRPVRSFRPRGVQGVIHKIEFLYPRPGDSHHVILLLVIVRNSKSWMVTYDWVLGDDLRHVFSEEKSGHRMPVEHQMPLLLIPLTVCSAFIAISPGQVSTCTGGLHGPPDFVEFSDLLNPPSTANFHGRDTPLWTVWTRPYRLSNYFKSRDCIYLAREDGAIVFLTVDAEGSIDSNIHIFSCDCSIAGAFTTLYDQFSDVLVVASDSGPGAIWKMPARKEAERLGTLQNSCPVVDFATTDDLSAGNDAPAVPSTTAASGKVTRPAQPSRIFATSGQGRNGSIAEYRYGLQARIGLDLEYGTGVKQAWVFASRLPGDWSFHLLLSMPDRTDVLQLSDDLSQVLEPDPEAVHYDMSSRTLAAVESGELVIQLTENYVVLVGRSHSAHFSYDLLEGYPDFAVADAAVLGRHIVVSAHSATLFRIFVLRIDHEGASVAPVCSFQVGGEVTSLCLCYRSRDEGTVDLLAGLWQDGRPCLAHATIGDAGYSGLESIDIAAAVESADRTTQSSSPSVEAIANIASCEHSAGRLILLGTRSGEVIALTSLERGPDFVECRTFGTTTANASSVNEPGGAAQVLVACDSNLILLSGYKETLAGNDAGTFRSRTRVWPVDVSDPTYASVPVDSVTVLRRNIFAEKERKTPLLILSGSRVLLAELSVQPGPVHRHIPIEGTPSRVLYSRHLQCLVVAADRRGISTLMFIDPDTGVDIGYPMDKNRIAVQSISGLEKLGDRIFGLAEWEYRRDNNTWRFILVSTRGGRLMILSAEREDQAAGEEQPRIRYWARFKKPKFDKPVYAVLGCDEGILYCVGHTIHWDVIDPVEKKLKPMRSFDLGSPATSLRIMNGKLVALTSRDSIEILDYRAAAEDGSSGLLHADPRTRNAVHMIEVAGPRPDNPQSSMVLVSDRDCGVGGLWVPWLVPGEDCGPVFEAELPVSIRKFCRAHTRPYWEQGGRSVKYGRLPSTVDDAEILGISLDGSLHHFTLLSAETWRLLRFIQNLALTSPELYPLSYETVDVAGFDPEPRLDAGLEMQVDGDMLGRCLEKRSLERLITWPSHLSRFAELLDELEDGRYTAEFGIDEEGLKERHFALAYDILDYLLAPAI